MVKKLTNEYQLLKEAFKPIDKEEYEGLLKQKEAIQNKEYTHSADYQSIMAKMQEFNKVVSEAQISMNENKKKYDALNTEKTNIQNNIIHYNNDIATLRETFISVKNSSRKCPNCNFELDKESINKRLKEINEKGTATGELIKKLTQKLESIDL